MPGKKLPKQKRKKSKLPSQALTVNENIDYFKLCPVFKFSNRDPNKWTLFEWNPDELKELMNTFTQMESITWYQLLEHGGLRLKKISGLNYPTYISPDETIYEIRVCKVKRIFGFIDKNIFNLVWFDRDHSVCPEGKNRKYG